MLPQDLILDHFHHPRNFGRLVHATHSAETENLSCGDFLAMDIIVKGDIIEEVAWTGNGCALSQASASLLSERIKGKDIEEAKRFSREDMFALLETALLSPARIRCALLSLETLHRALEKK